MTTELMRPDQAEADTDTSETPPLLAWLETHSSAGSAKELRSNADPLPALGPQGQVVAPEVATDHVLDLSDTETRRLRKLLKERQALLAVARTTMAQISKIERIVKAIMGPAEAARFPNWEISYRIIRRKECVVPASEYRRLVIKRLEDV